MENTLKEMTLAVLHNNELIMSQTEDINKKNGDSNQALDNMRKIYDGVWDKIEKDPESLTTADCKFLVIAINITLVTLERQKRTIESSIELYKKLQEVYSAAGESADNLKSLLTATNVLDIPEEETATTKAQTSEEK